MQYSKNLLESIQFPVFAIVFGPSKDYISRYNRTTHSELFSCDICHKEEDIDRLTEGYEGPISDLEIYIVPNPSKVIKCFGTMDDYEEILVK